MTNIMVDIPGKTQAASSLGVANGNLNSEYDTRVRPRLDQLSGLVNGISWCGRAGTVAQTRILEITNGNDARATAIQNFENLLLGTIPRFIAAENENISLADQFK